jgi:hypothetical protein
MSQDAVSTSGKFQVIVFDDAVDEIWSDLANTILVDEK